MASTHDPKSSGSSGRSCVLRMEMICREAKLRPRKEGYLGAFERKSPRLNRLSRSTRHRLGTTADGARNARCQSQTSGPSGRRRCRSASNRDIRLVRIAPASMAFTLLISFLGALPSFAIDMSLPGITETAAALRVAPARAGLMMSLFMVGFAVAPLFYGPASDRYGRKPIVVFACMLFVIAGIARALAQSLTPPLMWRVGQRASAGASMTIAFAIIPDPFQAPAPPTNPPPLPPPTSIS